MHGAFLVRSLELGVRSYIGGYGENMGKVWALTADWGRIGAGTYPFLSN